LLVNVCVVNVCVVNVYDIFISHEFAAHKMAGTLDTTENVWKNWDRYLPLLTAESKAVRRKTLQHLLKAVEALPPNLWRHFGPADVPRANNNNNDSDDDDDNEEEGGGGGDGDTPPLEPGVSMEMMVDASLSEIEQITRPLLVCFNDSMEKVRELAIQSILILTQRLPRKSILSLTPYLVPVLVERLGQAELTEPSEEVRLVALNLMQALLIKLKSELAPFVDDWLRILAVTITDPYHEVRKLTCQVTSESATQLSHVFHYNSERLVKPLCASITHQQSKVRLAVVQCIGKWVEDLIISREIKI
jgi:hypothetical protein